MSPYKKLITINNSALSGDEYSKQHDQTTNTLRKLENDYNKAISVYLTLLEHVNDRVKKEELLELLGTTYFKGGFLQRSKDIFLRILKFSPRNKNALKYLLLVNGWIIPQN